MKLFTLFALGFCFPIQAAHCKDIMITILRENSQSSYFVDDETTTVRDAAVQYLREFFFDTNPKHLRMESRFGMTYPLDKTLKDAGIKHGTIMKIKFWSRIEDAGAHIKKVLDYPNHGSKV